MAPVLFAALAHPRPARVRAGAVEDPVEEAVGRVGSGRAAKDAEYDVEDRVGYAVAYGEAHRVQYYLDDLPAAGPQQAYYRGGNDGVAWRVEELVVPAAAVDDLRDDRHEDERRQEVGDLVVHRHRLEEPPHKPGPVQRDADQDQQDYPPTRHIRTLPVATRLPFCLYPRQPELEHALGHLVAVAAAGLVALLGPHEDDRGGGGGRASVYEALGAGGVPAAAGADGPELDYLVGLGEQPRHRAEGLAAEVHVEARRDHLVAGVGELAGGLHDARVEELGLLDGDDVGRGVHPLQELGAGADGDGLVGDAVVRPDLVVLRTGLKRVLEDLHPAAGVERAAGEPDQLLRLAGEHGARDNGQGTRAERRVLF